LTSFGSVRLALLSFLTLPSALVGGVLAAYLSDGVLSLGSLVGFLTVLGIAARNGILLIDHCQHLERYEGETFGPRLVLRGARERLSPILMTTLATGLAIVPLVVPAIFPATRSSTRSPSSFSAAWRRPPCSTCSSSRPCTCGSGRRGTAPCSRRRRPTMRRIEGST